jgi:hypothetical protein
MRIMPSSFAALGAVIRQVVDCKGKPRLCRECVAAIYILGRDNSSEAGVQIMNL